MIKIAPALNGSSYLETPTIEFLIYHTLKGSLKRVVSLQGQTVMMSYSIYQAFVTIMSLLNARM